ncbi:MAG: plasmid pRiA4b ORF-3 family protein [Bacteroidota bacterium]|nr:plasmid pRiA4b ORF-3 family protein [Bacteroidota bacterium]MDX5431749.1 plasmid pRiA4b ORF-3 family protein [Bacteroidota bacterium]MDX5470464.1 plasmid pRiA4b ORF-3 family protein [Bacteroidota bacterium]
MAIYRFKVCFEEDEEIVRVIEIKSNQTIEDLHFAILKSIEFDSKHNALLYISDDYWKKHDKYIFLPEAGMEEVPMFSVKKLSSLINDPHQKLLYIYDLSEQWVFLVELIGISMTEDAKKDYPYVVRSENKAPKQYKTQAKVGGDLEEDELDYLTKNLLSGEIAEEMLGQHLDEGETDEMDEEGEDQDNEDQEDEFFGGDEGYDED